MGGQACVFYGAAEFSRDIDLAILADEANLDRLRAALKDLDAEPIAVPPLALPYLARGHAVHFRCRAAGVDNLRLDVMASMRGVAPFAELWSRRTTLPIDSEDVDLLSLEDLVLAKKTQLDKDWPMVRRLVERSYFSQTSEPGEPTIVFWLCELRTPSLLCTLANKYSRIAADLAASRPAVEAALRGDAAAVAERLAAEEHMERERDRLYWEPLRRELEQLRRARRTEGERNDEPAAEK